MVKTARRVFHHWGSEQAGCSLYFHTYCQTNSILKFPLAPFWGTNLTTAIFYDAAGVRMYFLKLHMEEYLWHHHSGELNHLLQAVLSDLQILHFVAGARALGIIDKTITGPLVNIYRLS